MCIELFLVFAYLYFNVCKGIFSFITKNDNFVFLVISVIDISILLILIYNFLFLSFFFFFTILFCFLCISDLPFDSFWFLWVNIPLHFPVSLGWKLKLLIWDFSSFPIQVFNATNFLWSTVKLHSIHFHILYLYFHPDQNNIFQFSSRLHLWLHGL